MPHVRGTVHGIGAMVMLVVGSVLTSVVREHLAVFASLSRTTRRLLVDLAGLPMSEDVAEVVLPVGVLMGIWVFAYELRQL
jgi:hypothetical protein